MLGFIFTIFNPNFLINKIMRNIFIQVFVILILFSCGGGENQKSNQEKEKTINELYNEFKSSETAQKCLDFDEKLQKNIQDALLASMLPSNPSGLSEVELDFQKNVLTGAYYSSTFIGDKKEINFYKQDSYNLLIDALNEGLDAYVVNGTKKQRLKSWEYNSSVIPEMITDSEYYLMLIVKSCTQPTTFDDNTFNPGALQGKVVVIDTKKGQALGSFDITANNKESLMFFEGEFLKSLREDLKIKINEAIISGLKTHTKSVQFKERQEPDFEFIY